MTPTPAAITGLLDELRDLLGDEGLLVDAAARAVYARDASHIALGRPLAVALPRDGDEAAAVVAACARTGVPVVGRGAGTGLSGGAVPSEGSLVLSLARLVRLDTVDAAERRVRAGAGVLNAAVSRHAASAGLHFAPDPSSQAAATIGGNVAENAGGPHCLRHGVTLQHVRRLEWIDARGRRWSTGHGAPAARGPDLAALLCGSEGTLGLVTAAELGLVPSPVASATLLAVFPRLDAATAAVVRLLGAGLLPVAVEMVDRAMLRAVEDAFAFGFPTDCDAVMIGEFAGEPDEVDADAAAAGELLAAAGACEVRRAADASERERLWTCRKKAFGAVGRLAPSYVTMDVVVPLGRLPRLVADIREIRAEHGVEIATAFHAGDGNLHPGVHYDDRDPDLARRAHAAADAIMRRALELGGSITGEHGVGLEKLHALPWQVDAVASGLMRGIKDLCDPHGVLNPGKALPADAAEWTPVPPAPASVRSNWDDLTVTVPAGADLAAVQDEALARGLWLPLGGLLPGEAPGLGVLGTSDRLIDQGLAGPPLVGGLRVRDALLEVWAEDGAGRLFHAGAPVMKNVAGYDLARLLVGAGGTLARVRGATWRLAPAPARLAVRAFAGAPAALVPRLTGLLNSRPPGAGAPTVVAEAGAERVWVLVAGRAEAWDLPAWLDGLAARTGLEPAGGADGPPADAAAVLAEAGLPAWARRSPDWSVASGTDGRRADPVAREERWIVAAEPRLLWLPEAVAASPRRHVDVVWRGGTATPLPAPPPDVPRSLLRGLKRLFDPHGVLPVPDWLLPRAEGHRDGS